MAPKRSLILAGGGLKVAFQAGVLQVWLDEAGLTFDHADGASGGCFNLAMYCQQMSGRKIADNWRTLDPFLPVDLNLEEYWRLAHAQSLFTYDNFRRRVLPFWGIDWARIRSSPKLGTFNLFNFSKKRLEVVTNAQIDEDRLISAVSLPMWFPPVTIDGDTYIDAVYICDANVEEAIRRGADEIWAIWTVSRRDEWRPGLVAQYFQIIETTANTNFFSIWERIKVNNADIGRGARGEFGRPIALKLIEAEVPLHYLFNFSQDRFAEAVNLGVRAAREWCDREGVPLPNRGTDPPVPPPSAVTSLEFTEEMRGCVSPGAATFEEGEAAGRVAGHSLRARLTIKVDNVDRFVTDPDHAAVADGFVESPLLGGRCPVERGTFNLLVHTTDPRKKQMRYRLFLKRPNGELCTLSGIKRVEADPGPFDAIQDTTTLFTTLLKGHVNEAQEAGAERIAIGIIRIGFFDFLRQLTTFRAHGPDPGAELQALNRFGLMFLGKLWETHAPTILGIRPI
ncbi:MAG: patatin-like phospholipase family protein [Vicinamibacterales bacterium]